MSSPACGGGYRRGRAWWPAVRKSDKNSNRANVSPVMLLASLLLPLAVIAIVLLDQRLHLPVFLAIMATVVVYGIAADM